MTFRRQLQDLTEALERGDGSAFAGHFCEDGVYNDIFYGTFTGRAAIREMIEDRFWRDGKAFRWQMFDPVAERGRGYARFLFSFSSTRPQSKGRRIVVEGMCFVQFSDGLIARYDEAVAPGIAYSQLGLPAEQIAQLLGDRADELRKRPDAAEHLVD